MVGRIRGTLVVLAMLGLCVAVSAAPWPINTSFESPDYTLGSLDGQQGWTAVNDAAVTAQSEAVYMGSQGVRLTSSSQAVYDGEAAGQNVVWIQGFCKAEAVDFYPDLPAPTSVTCFLFFHQTDGIVCLDGDGSGSGTWRTTGLGAADWTRLSIRQDYSSNTWDMYVNGTRVFTALGNAYHGSTFDRFEAQAGETGPMYLDAFYSAADQPFTGFSTGQQVSMTSVGQGGAFLYNYGTSALEWVDWAAGSTYDASLDLQTQQWEGIFVYDYDSGTYQKAMYMLKDTF